MQEGLTILEKRESLAIGASWAVLALALLCGVLELAGLAGLVRIYDYDGLESLTYGIVIVAFSLIFLLSMILVSIWIHRAHANMHEAGIDGLEFTPGWAVGWFAIPIANLFKPYQAMKELWNSSSGLSNEFGGEAPGILNFWWATWLLSGFVSYAGLLGGLDPIDPPAIVYIANAASYGLTAASAWFLLKIIAHVTSEQVSGVGTAQVFE